MKLKRLIVQNFRGLVGKNILLILPKRGYEYSSKPIGVFYEEIRLRRLHIHCR